MLLSTTQPKAHPKMRVTYTRLLSAVSCPCILFCGPCCHASFALSACPNIHTCGSNMLLVLAPSTPYILYSCLLLLLPHVLFRGSFALHHPSFLVTCAVVLIFYSLLCQSFAWLLEYILQAVNSVSALKSAFLLSAVIFFSLDVSPIDFPFFFFLGWLGPRRNRAHCVIEIPTFPNLVTHFIYGKYVAPSFSVFPQSASRVGRLFLPRSDPSLFQQSTLPSVVLVFISNSSASQSDQANNENRFAKLVKNIFHGHTWLHVIEVCLNCGVSLPWWYGYCQKIVLAT